MHHFFPPHRGLSFPKKRNTHTGKEAAGKEEIRKKHAARALSRLRHASARPHVRSVRRSDSFDTVDAALDVMRDVLLHDTRAALSTTLDTPPDDLRYCTVDLSSDNPGIVHTTRPTVQTLRRTDRLFRGFEDGDEEGDGGNREGRQTHSSTEPTRMAIQHSLWNQNESDVPRRVRFDFPKNGWKRRDFG